MNDPATESRAPACGYIPKASMRSERTLASKIGGFGVCGRPVCCARWLASAADHKVSIRMAKRQRVSLSPENLNGYCCHMKCCLAFEVPQDTAPPEDPETARNP